MWVQPRKNFLFVAMLGLPLWACSSDSAPVPEADLGTPGVFVAVDDYDVPGEMVLLRVLDHLQLETDRLLFLTVYDVQPKSFDDAREIAKDHTIPIRMLIRIEPDKVVTDHPYELVWFRTLTQEEQDRTK